MRKPWPTGACWAMGKNKEKIHDDYDDFGLIYRKNVSEFLFSIS
jgi:hypothetical protein